MRKTNDPELVAIFVGTVYLLAGGITGPWLLAYGHVLLGVLGLLIAFAGITVLTWAFIQYQWPALKLLATTYWPKR